MTSRIAHDCYPTPPDAAEALALWLPPPTVDHADWLDPAAGPGLLLRRFGGDRSRRHAIELQPRFAPDLESVADHIFIGDAKRAAWPDAHVCANPPFDQLDDFIRLAVDHVLRTGYLAAVLMRVGWLDDGGTVGRERYRTTHRPTHILRMPWRHRFRADKPGSDNTTHCWAVWAGRMADGPTETTWATRPTVSAEDAARYAELCGDIVDLPTVVGVQESLW